MSTMEKQNASRARRSFTEEFKGVCLSSPRCGVDHARGSAQSNPLRRRPAHALVDIMSAVVGRPDCDLSFPLLQGMCGVARWSELDKLLRTTPAPAIPR